MYNIFLARTLGIENFGFYTLALSYFALATLASDIGVTRYFQREIVQNEEKTANIFTNTLAVRVGLSLILFLTFGIFFYLTDSNPARGLLILLTFLTTIPQTAAGTFDSLLVAKHRIFFSAVGIVFLNILTVFFGVTFIYFNLGVFATMTALLASYSFYFVFLFVLVLNQKYKIWDKFSLPEIRKLVTGSFIYGIIGLLGVVYFRIDNIILGYIKGGFDTGIYGAGYKFFEAIVIIPASVSTVLFPVLAKAQDASIRQRKESFKKIIITMAGLSLMITPVFYFLVPELIRFFIPNYKNSVDVVRILAIAIPFVFLHIPLSQIMLSRKKYLKPLLMISFIPLTFNIISNLYFIPIYSYYGAAWITVLSDALSLLVLLYAIRRYVLTDE